MSCGGISAAANEVTKLADGVKDFAKDLGEEALGSVASLVQAQVGALNAEIDKAFPDLPEPVGNLQSDMSDLAGAVNDPGAFMQKVQGMKDKYPGLAMDEMFAQAGMDPKKIDGLSKQVEGIINQPLTGDTPEKIGALLGGFENPFSENIEQIAESICSKLPNFEISADGIMKKLGIPTPVPTKDADPVEPTPGPVEGGEVEVDPGNGHLEGQDNIPTRSTEDEVKKIEKKRNDRMSAEVKALYAIRRTQEQLTNKSKKASDAERLNAITHHIQMAIKDITYEAEKEKFEVGAVPHKPPVPKLSQEEFDTVYVNNMDYGAQTEALPYLVIS